MSTTDAIIQFNPDVYYQNALVRGRSKADTRRLHLVVDSRERNRRLFPNPNDYEVNMVRDMQDVREIYLIASSFPFSRYLVHEGNDLMYVCVAGTSMHARVAHGDYADPAELAAAVDEALNAATASRGDMFQVTYDARTDKFAVSCTRSFFVQCKGRPFQHAFNNNKDFAYPERSIARLLGFGVADYESSVNEETTSVYRNRVAAPFRRNIYADDTLVVHVDALDVNHSTSDAVDKSFALIYRNACYPEYTKVSYYDDDKMKKTFIPPLRRLNKIKVRVTDYDGNPYDFQNQDHRMEFIVDLNIKAAS
jgi:hypothetical protein